MNNPHLGAMLAALLLMCAAPIVAAAPEPMTEAVGPNTLSGDDLEFFREAAQEGMLDVQAAGIAATLAQAPETRTFATRMATDHAVNNDTLRSLAFSKGVVLPSQLDSQRRERLSEMQNGGPKEFDERYAKVMRDGHHDAVELFEEAVTGSPDADIRAYASNTLPALRQHLEMAERLTKG